MKRLYRSKKDKMIAGICGGIATYFSIDPTLVRLGFVFAAAITAVAPMVIVYCVGWLIIPQEPESQQISNVSP